MPRLYVANKMKILILSDLHIEFENYEIDCSNVDLVILAGDIHVKDHGFKWASDKIKNIPVIYVFRHLDLDDFKMALFSIF